MSNTYVFNCEYDKSCSVLNAYQIAQQPTLETPYSETRNHVTVLRMI